MNNVNNRKMFRPRGARNKLNQMGGIMASSVPLMQTVQRFATGTGPRGIIPFGSNPVDAEDTNLAGASRNRFLELARRRRGFLSPTEIDELDTFYQRGFRDPNRAQPSFITDFLNNTGTNVTPRPASEILMAGTGVDAEDTNLTSTLSPDFNVTPRPVSTVTPSTLEPSPQTAAELEADDAASAPVMPTISEQINKTSVSAAQQVSKMNRKNPESVRKTSKEIGSDIMKLVQSGELDEAEDTIAKITGADEAAQASAKNTEDRIRKQSEMIAKFLGKSPEDYKKDRGLAIASAAFTFAQTGDIGEAGNKLVDELKVINADQRKRDDAATTLAINTVLGREAKESDRAFAREMKSIDQAHDWKKVSTLRSDKLKMFTADMNFRGYLNDVNNALKIDLKDKDIDILNARLQQSTSELATRIESSENIARLGRESQERIAQANNEASYGRAVLSGLGDGTKLALIEGQAKGLTGEALNDFVIDRGKELATSSVLTGPDSVRRLITTMAPTIIKEEGGTFGEAVDQIVNGIVNDPTGRLQQIYGADLRQMGLFTAPQFDSVPSDAELEALVNRGVTEIQIKQPDGKYATKRIKPSGS